MDAHDGEFVLVFARGPFFRHPRLASFLQAFDPGDMAGKAKGLLPHVGDAALHGGQEGAQAVGVEGLERQVMASDMEVHQLRLRERWPTMSLLSLT